MSVEKSLAKPPFNLSSEDIDWVRKTRDGLSTSDKIRQLFVHISFGHNANELIATKPGGYMPVESDNLEQTWNMHHRYLSECEIPPFLCQDLEGGGNHRGATTNVPSQLAFAAVNDMQACSDALDVMAKEASALGFNWSFTPCIDINHAIHSAIVGTRSYGSNIDTISKHARLHVDILRRHGIATAAKHWPGEGYDARDQHLVTTLNPLSVEEWTKTFGRIYRELVNDGILSVMSAHISLPAYAAKHGVPDTLDRYRPASMSKLLNNTLLRQELGFNGLIVSDATPMAGLTSFTSRAEQVPGVIESGCDMFLFCTNVEADFKFMEEGLKSGALSEQRLEDAITRVLGMKAALGLHRKSISERIKPLEEIRAMVNNPAHAAASQKVADQSVSLVKDVRNILPLNPAKHRRITWIGRPAPGFLPGMPETQMQVLRDGLARRGFEVRDFDAQDPPTPSQYRLPALCAANRIFIGKIAHLYRLAARTTRHDEYHEPLLA